jgi:putative nucleotidyltransferase with HDIG domain
MAAMDFAIPSVDFANPSVDFAVPSAEVRGFSSATPIPPAPIAISFSAIISALSFAIDLTEGAVPGHALRTCILGMKIAAAANLPENQVPPLYHALLLKDVGCSSNAARMCQIVGGDDRVVKNGAKLQDWTKPHKPTLDTLKRLWTQVLPPATALKRVARIGKIALNQHKNNEEMIALRCERGARIAHKLGLSDDTARAIHALDEHWDGSGYPGHLKGNAIPKLARILAVAQHLDVFASERDRASALQVLEQRSGRWFDPELVRLTLQLDRNNRLWTDFGSADSTAAARKLVLDLEPEHRDGVASEEVDRICEAFADVVDAKSPFTFRHSMGVADVATSLSIALQLAPDRVQLVRRAALLHDLGKLAVPNTILDKETGLTPEEWETVVQHPRLTREILARIEPFAELAGIAGAHHEKLDGSGYPDGLKASQLGLEARIVAVADVYQALTERRPYRKGMSHAEAMKVLYRLAGQKLDPHCIAALSLVRDPWTVWTPTSRAISRSTQIAMRTGPVQVPALRA